jgi:DNA invertase Pin-like site-specific DNA recombinase
MRAVIYARYSDSHQREESVEGQLRECGDFAQRKGYAIVKTYADRAISGQKAENRPQFMQMIEDSKQRMFDIVIVWKIDRFSRDKYDSVFYKNALKKNGVSVISATEPIDDSPEGQLMESIFEGFSVYYLKDLSMKVSRGMTENALKGKFNGGSPTYGYVIDADKRFQPDPVKALIVADIFRRYASGESIKSILVTLKEEGLQTGHNKAPTYSFIVNLIKNRRYLGEYRFKDTVIENAFASLIDAEVFEKCQKRLAENQHRPASFKPVEDKYSLTGKIYCGYCGDTMHGKSAKSKTGAIHRYYHCRAAKKLKTCGKKRINKSLVESLVIDYILRMLDDAPLLNRIVEACYDLQTNKDSLMLLEKRLAKVQKEIDNVMAAIKQGIITPSTKETLMQLEQDKENLTQSIVTTRIERPVLSKEQIRHWICRFKGSNPDDPEQKQRLIETFLRSVYVYDDKMLIVLKYKDGEICVTFDEVQSVMSKKRNPDNHKDYQSSPLKVFGDPSGTFIRTLYTSSGTLSMSFLSSRRLTAFVESEYPNTILISSSYR